MNVREKDGRVEKGLTYSTLGAFPTSCIATTTASPRLVRAGKHFGDGCIDVYLSGV